MIPTPTRAELAQRLRLFERQFRRSAILAFALWGLAFAIVCSLAVAANDTRYEWMIGVGFALSLLFVFAGAFHLDRRRAKISREVGVTCGACGKALLQLNAKLALTTGRCPECGSLVISDP